MHRTTLLALFLLLLPLPGLAQKLSAVISPTGKQALDSGCRKLLEKKLGAVDLRVLPREADAVTGDVVVNVTLTGTDGEGEGPANCGLLVFVTPTGEKMVTVEQRGPDRLSACRAAAEKLEDGIRTPLKKLIERGLPQVVVLRWSKRLQPDPVMSLSGWFKKGGIQAKPALQTRNGCTFRFDSKTPPDEFEIRLKAFLQKRYRVSSEPPGNLPQAKRTFMFLLRAL